jgi:alcohol dehydrogenase class IV
MAISGACKLLQSAACKQASISCIWSGTVKAQALADSLAALSVPLGAKGLLLYKDTDKVAAGRVVQMCRKRGIALLQQPLTDTWPAEIVVQSLSENARRVGSSLLMAVGCGETINIAKAVAMRATNMADKMSPNDIHQFQDASIPLLAWPSMPSFTGTCKSTRLVRNNGAPQMWLPGADSRQVNIFDADMLDSLPAKASWSSILEGLFHSMECALSAEDQSEKSVHAYSAFLVLLAAATRHARLPTLKQQGQWINEIFAAHALLGLAKDTSGLGPTDALASILADRYKIHYSDAAASIGPEVNEWYLESLDNKLADEDDAQVGDLSQTAVPSSFASTARDNILTEFDAHGLSEQLEFAATALASHSYEGSREAKAHARLTDLRSLMAGFLKVPTLTQDVARGLSITESTWGSDSSRMSVSALALQPSDVSAIAEAAEVHPGCTSAVVTPSTKQIAGIFQPFLQVRAAPRT